MTYTLSGGTLNPTHSLTGQKKNIFVAKSAWQSDSLAVK